MPMQRSPVGPTQTRRKLTREEERGSDRRTFGTAAIPVIVVSVVSVATWVDPFFAVFWVLGAFWWCGSIVVGVVFLFTRARRSRFPSVLLGIVVGAVSLFLSLWAIVPILIWATV